jgi:hypothetical protein
VIFDQAGNPWGEQSCGTNEFSTLPRAPAMANAIPPAISTALTALHRSRLRFFEALSDLRLMGVPSVAATTGPALAPTVLCYVL